MEVKWCERHYKVGVHSKKNNGYVLTGNAKANPVLNENDLYLKIIAEYPSVREAERQLGYKWICACLVGKQKTVHGHIFKYKQL